MCRDSSYAITVRDADSSVFTSVIYLNQPSFSFETQVQEINNYGVNCNWDCNGEISINSQLEEQVHQLLILLIVDSRFQIIGLN